MGSGLFIHGLMTPEQQYSSGSGGVHSQLEIPHFSAEISQAAILEHQRQNGSGNLAENAAPNNTIPDGVLLDYHKGIFCKRGKMIF